MKKMVATFGTLLIAAVIILSGSATAATHFVKYISESYCTNIGYIDGPPDNLSASLGQDGTPPRYGTVRLDLGSGNEMGASQVFTVFYANNTESEQYQVFVGEDLDEFYLVGSGNDQADRNFTTPNWGSSWRYIILVGISGSSTGDPAYGPEIDAVGW